MFLKKVLSLFLIVSLCSPLTAKASSLQCRNVFATTVSDVVVGLNQETSRFLLRGKTLDDFSKTLSWNQKRVLRRILNTSILQSGASPEAVERYSLELSTVLFGKREVADNWILKNKEQRLESSAVTLLKEQILRDGLVKTWKNEHDPAQVSKLSKITDKMWTLMYSKPAEIVSLVSGIIGATSGQAPFFLPKIFDKTISPELQFKVLRDGFSVHKEAVRIALKHQTHIEAYNTFRRLYQPIIMAVYFIVMAQESYETYQQSINSEVDALISDLKSKREFIEKNISELKKEQAQLAFEQALVEFQNKWGEAPTDSEKSIIRNRIEESLNLQK
ncbi:hypothetical protein [Bdellovibrio bacteriovorus]|uniref:Uncharacterized protein n=1 Tax=Bdellovibrio bacteriovorus str. Tiberius TaxID=1069642 RepID=K7ZES2_BDEBC|nr:hypothetical protein [Bdellovibrio bacteriovorus]AFY00782.1 hypothetical protein Bdt_1082 [Bdellovibrio bacteriovorus str. Tiberius]